MNENELLAIYAIMKKWEGKESIFFTDEQIKLVENELKKINEKKTEK